ncbi:MAG TPA: ATP-dependent protease ATPase subunit HslU [Candidatus Saccharimonadales bacterium]|nr:ATP-dependent protease ATPase subunit HslU [Candidatus Saccharimonadales bacterium]
MREAGPTLVAEESMTPRQIVFELDKYVVGQSKAKRAVAVALRNRIRRQRLPPDLAEEIAPKNIIMIGPTGVGKTEIARRLARLTRSPFLKVEASKFTEVGYVGRDVDSMIRDLVEVAVSMVRQEKMEEVRQRASQRVEDRLLAEFTPKDTMGASPAEMMELREKLREDLRRGRMDERTIEVEVKEKTSPGLQIFSNQGMEEMNINLQQMMPGLFPTKSRPRRMTVAEAKEHLLREEEERLVDPEEIAKSAIVRVEGTGIVFLDEIDKVAGREGGHGPEVSREGVQRDLLPIIEGSTVNTKYGTVRTDHILFIASGAFYVAKPSDLIPELQGRFPIRVELDALGKDEFVRILTQPETSLVKQYTALMETEGLHLTFTPDAVESIALYAATVNERMENIGARRLHTIMEKVLDEILFEGAEMQESKVVIDAAYVDRTLADVVKDQDLSKYIL